MRPVTVTVGPLATASANNIALSQTPTAGALLINGATASGGVATLDEPRRVLITTSADETTKTFTITGTNWSGSTISEAVAGVNNSTVASVLDYATVTSIRISANAAGALTVGTNGVAGSPWVRFDDWGLPSVAIGTVVSGTVNYTIQQTMDDPNSATDPVTPALVTWLSHPDSNFVAATTSVQSNYAFPPLWSRVLLNSGTGTVTTTFLQTGVNPV